MDLLLWALWTPAGFAVGLAIGVLWTWGYVIARGKDDPVDLVHRLSRSALTALAVGMLISMTMTGIVGVTLMTTNTRLKDLVACNTRYNELSGEVRDARTEASESAADDERRYVEQDLAYQLGLLRALTADPEQRVDRLTDVIERRRDATQERLRTLRELDQARKDAPYPAPDYCQAAK